MLTDQDWGGRPYEIRKLPALGAGIQRLTGCSGSQRQPVCWIEEEEICQTLS